MINEDGGVDASDLTVVVPEGKIFKMIGVAYLDVVLECEKKHYTFNASLFSEMFEATEVSF